MVSYSSLAEKLRDAFESRKATPSQKSRCVVGFDGFTDEIILSVDKRINEKNFVPIELMEKFGQRIVDAAGKSCNIELVVREKRLGGNAPLFANALLEGGHYLTFIGPIGEPGHVEPLFEPFASRCEKVVTLGPSAITHALEFSNGKVLMGKVSNVMQVGWNTIHPFLSNQEWIELLDQADLLGCANWTMLPLMTDLWKHLLKEIIPHFKSQRQRWMYIDLADPAKRSTEDIKEALDVLAQFSPSYSVVLGLNEAEGERIAQVLGIEIKGKDLDKNTAIATEIQKRSSLQQIVVHPRTYAIAATAKEIVSARGAYIEKPRISTGGGDNFNAGYCQGLLFGLSPQESLISGVATSGFYVKEGRSPTLPELANFLSEGF